MKHIKHGKNNKKIKIDMKNINKIALLCLIMALVSCGNGKQGKEEGLGKQFVSETYKLVIKNINDMASKPWDKKKFEEIRDNQIPQLKKSSERTSAKTKLETAYCNLLVNESSDILQKGCTVKEAHTRLNAMINELNGMIKLNKAYSNVPGRDKLLSLKKIHDDASAFTRNAFGYQHVSSYRDKYDTSYETNQRAKAGKYLGQSDLKCVSIRSSLQKITSSNAYDYRRRAYCEAIVKCYLNCTNPSTSEKNAAKASLNVYNGYKQTWLDKIDDHYNELNSKNN
ncbi:MAG: hypothetical protein LUC88_01150 [Prevotella sp.]|nr:hypothetical protein [Prevotella sp.]